MDREQREALIERYLRGYDVVVAALDGADLDAREADGEWSPREVVHHLADSEMTSAIRVRRLLVEDDPLIQGYDQDAFAARLFYDRPIEASLAAFKAARDTTGEIITRLTDDQWLRTGTHSESGRYTLLDWLAIYAEHAYEHADQIRRSQGSVSD
jgi:hypothetical protein